jgi:hypothetical protein
MAVESKDTDGEPPKEYRNTLTRSRTSRLREHLVAEVDPEKAILPLTCYCFMTGYVRLIFLRNDMEVVLTYVELA